MAGGVFNVKWSKESHVVKSELKRLMLLLAMALVVGAISSAAVYAQEEA